MTGVPSTTAFIDAKLVNLLKMQAAMYMESVKQALKADEASAEHAIRGWMRAWGHWRGVEMRKGHEAVGYPVNMDSVIRHWDSASTHHLGDEWADSSTFSACCSVTPIPSVAACFHAQVFREHDFWRWGHVFCDELHQSLVSGYCPGGAVVIPVNLMKRDDRCEFLWVYPGESCARVFDVQPAADAYQSEETRQAYRLLWASGSPEEGARSCMARTERNGAALWLFICKELEGLFSAHVDAVARQALSPVSALRGKLLKELHEELGVGCSPVAFFEGYDQMLSPLSDVRIDSKPGSAVATVTSCPLDDVWSELDGRRFGSIYCQESYKAVLSSYLPEASFELISARSLGDSVCQLAIRL